MTEIKHISGVWSVVCSDHGVLASFLYTEGDRALLVAQGHIEAVHK